MATTKTNEPTLEDVSAQLEVLKSDIASLTKLLGDVGKAQVNQASDRVHAKAQDIRAEGLRYAHAAGESADAALDVVRKQPVTAISIAVGLGFLFGLVAGRR